MGTRAMIKIQGSEIAVYKHWDGYPSATLPWLISFYKEFHASRGGENVDYCLAALLRSSARDANAFNLDTSHTSGWGVIMSRIDYGQEYTYELMANGSVKCNKKVVYKPGDEIPSAEKLERIS